ncbi:MAG: hypothetical protein KBC12_01415 [Candidatus Pacebacteria bacterium]|nr:hypothetical protein [Candidatus Paceibacterota bacterium]MBP9851467.1 hypothetical protein [Candidatus Paceibacterota bacterium]
MGVDYEAVNNVELAANGAPAEHITDLSAVPESSKEAILKANEVKQRLLDKSKGVEGVNQEKLLKLAEDIEFTQNQLEILSQALIESCKELPAEIEQAGRDLKTTYEYKNTEADSARLEKLGPNKKRALYFTLSLLQRTCKYPYILMGSIPHTVIAGENTMKVPNDSDLSIGTPDLAGIYSELKKLEKEGKVVNLEIIPLTDLTGEKDNSFEIKYFVDTGGSKLEEVSLFANNINTEKEDNGLISAGYKQNEVRMCKLKNPDNDDAEDVVAVPLAGLESNDSLYAQNVLLEISTLDFMNAEERDQKYSWVTPKMLQRLDNLMRTNGNNFDNVIELLRKVKDSQTNEVYKVHFEKSFNYIVSMREYLSNRKDLQKGTETGLASNICKKENFPEKYCTEMSVTFMTKTLKVEMQKTFSQFTEAKQIFDSNLEPGEKRAKVQEIYETIATYYEKYDMYFKKINMDDPRDVTLAIGARGMEHDYLYPAAMGVMDMLEKLENKK